MNQSKKWVVRHEPETFTSNPKVWRGHLLIIDVRLVAPRFHQRQYYGEVNSFLRHVLLELPVERRGVILRDPRDILVSALNWDSAGRITRRVMDIIALGYRAMDQALQDEAVIPIRFEQMTTSVSYLQDVLKAVGVEDVRVSEATCTQKVNAPRSYKIKTYADIPAPVRCYYDAQTGWYREKYYADT